jgi:predicted deacylase
VGEEFEIKTSHIVYRQDILCRSVCGLPVYVLTISGANARRKRRVIYITARVHAGETPSSFVMQKVIQELTNSVAGQRYKYEQLL